MSDTTSTILIKLLSTGDLSALTRGKEQAESLKVSLEGLKSTLELVGVGFSIGEIAEQTKAAVEYGSAIKTLATNAGISTDAFQKLSFAAINTGVNQQDLGNALNTLQKNMAEAAAGTVKQNRAITDLGLNTAELLSLPVEDQIKAIAVAYTNAEDKGRAWADVVALLGKNSAHLKGILDDFAKNGTAGEQAGLIISKEDLERLEKVEQLWNKIIADTKAVKSQAVARPVDAANTMMAALLTGGASLLAGPASFENFENKGKSGEAGGDKSEADKQAKIDAINAQLQATNEAAPAMIALNKALAKSISEETLAYDTAAVAAGKLRAMAADDETSARIIMASDSGPDAQAEGMRLQIEASGLRKQANQLDVKAAKEKAQYAAQEAELSQRNAQDALKLTPIYNQLVQAKQHQLSIEQQISALSPQSLTYDQDHLKLGNDLRTVKAEVATLTEKEYTEMVAQFDKEEEMAMKRAAIAITAIDHDKTLSDSQKWTEKKKIWDGLIVDQQTYIANMKTIEGDASAPSSARNTAGNNAQKGMNNLAGTKGQDLGANPHSFLANFNADLVKVKSSWGTFQQQMASGLTGQISQAVNTVSRGINGWLSGAMTFKQGLASIWTGFAQSAEQAFAQMAAKYLVSKIAMFAIDEAMAAKGLILSAASAAKSLIMWLPSAIAASISSWGIAAAIGAAAVIAIVASNKGFESGGYTGGTEGEAAGTVHGQEFVWSAPAVRNIGVGNLERAHQAALAGGSGVSGGGGSGQAGQTIVNAFSSEDVARALRTHIDARVYRSTSKIGRSRMAL